MDTLRQKLKVNKDAQAFLQAELALRISSHHSNICKYEPDEVKPPIDMVEKIANFLETTAAYLFGETEDKELLRYPSMIKRLNDIAKFPEQDKTCILYALDAMINNVKLKAI